MSSPFRPPFLATNDPTHRLPLPRTLPTPPITPNTPCFPLPDCDTRFADAPSDIDLTLTPCTPDSDMAAIVGTPVTQRENAFGVPEGASLFQEHLLTLLLTISQHPSPSFPFPSPTNDGIASLAPFSGDKTPADDAIERAVLAIGERIRNDATHVSRQPSPVTVTQKKAGPPPPAPLLTPDWTPPIDDEQPSPVAPVESPPTKCASCSRPIHSTPNPRNSPPASQPLSLSFSTPQQPVSQRLLPNPTHNILTTASGASVLTRTAWPPAADSGMSAEKELELLKAQVQDIARVCKAVATGDLTQKIIVPVEGQAMTELKDIINSMVDRLKTFAVEVERVSLEVGTQGKLGGQAVVEGVEGTWRELTAVVNTLAANLTTQVRSIAKVTKVRVA